MTELPSTTPFGIVTSSFLIVRTRVASSDVSMMSPNVSPSLHPIAEPERTRVRQHDPGDHVRERRARREGEQHAHEHRHAGERGEFDAGRYGKGDHDAEGDEEHPDNLVRRGRPLGGEVLESDAALSNLLEEQSHEPNRRSRRSRQ